jgi:hypothetical protein
MLDYVTLAGRMSHLVEEGEMCLNSSSFFSFFVRPPLFLGLVQISKINLEDINLPSEKAYDVRYQTTITTTTTTTTKRQLCTNGV